MTDGHTGSANPLLQPLISRPETAIVVVDYDGTISPIVDDPAAAVPFDDAAAVLSELRGRFADVVVVSGRPLSFLTQVLPAELSLVGVYGLEGLKDGVRWEHPNGGVWREVMADVALLAQSTGPPGMRVELKDLSITFHYRGRPELQAPVTDFALAQAERSGLRTRPARMSVELHPPIDIDKGTIIERAAVDASGVFFAGDDVGDLTAFDALDKLASNGVSVVRVAVASDEAPAELIRRADIVVDGPPGVLELLRVLASD